MATLVEALFPLRVTRSSSFIRETLMAVSALGSQLGARRRPRCTHSLNTQLPIYHCCPLEDRPQLTERRPYFLTLNHTLTYSYMSGREHACFYRGGAVKTQIWKLDASKDLRSAAGVVKLEVYGKGPGTEAGEPDCPV